MKKLILLITTLFSLQGNCQDISGLWKWKDPDSRFTIDIEQENASTYTGDHSSAFNNGKNIDASIDEKSISLTKISTNIFEGTIESSYSLTTHKVRITYHPSDNSIEWHVYEESPGLFYFPRKVTMYRAGKKSIQAAEGNIVPDTHGDAELCGIWKSIDDPKWVWEFRSDGKLYSLYEGKLLTTFSFSVETTSPQCGNTVKVDPLFKYLKLTDLSDNLTQCYEFASFDNDFIEVRKLGSGGFMGFKKSTSSIEEPDDNFDFGDGDQKIN